MPRCPCTLVGAEADKNLVKNVDGLVSTSMKLRDKFFNAAEEHEMHPRAAAGLAYTA